MFDITKRTTITTDWAQLRTVQEKMNLAEIMLEVGSEFPICLEADADNENDVFEQLTAQVVHVTKEGRVKEVPGRGTWWYWLRSPRGSNSASFCGVNSSGNAGYSAASNARGVAFGFCL